MQLQEQTEAFEEERRGCELQMERQDTDLLEALENGQRLQARLDLLGMENADEGDERHMVKAEGDYVDQREIKCCRKRRSRKN